MNKCIMQQLQKDELVIVSPPVILKRTLTQFELMFFQNFSAE